MISNSTVHSRGNSPRHIGHNNQYVLLQLIGKVFGCREGQTRRDNTLDPDCQIGDVTRDSRGIRGQVDEEGTVADTSALLEVLLEESSSLHVNTHSSEDDGEVVLVTVVNALASSRSLDKTGLSTDLSSNLMSDNSHRRFGTNHLIVRQTLGSAEINRNESSEHTCGTENGDLLTTGD